MKDFSCKRYQDQVKSEVVAGDVPSSCINCTFILYGSSDEEDKQAISKSEQVSTTKELQTYLKISSFLGFLDSAFSKFLRAC